MIKIVPSKTIVAIKKTNNIHLANSYKMMQKNPSKNFHLADREHSHKPFFSTRVRGFVPENTSANSCMRSEPSVLCFSHFSFFSSSIFRNIWNPPTASALYCMPSTLDKLLQCECNIKIYTKMHTQYNIALQPMVTIRKI